MGKSFCFKILLFAILQLLFAGCGESGYVNLGTSPGLGEACSPLDECEAGLVCSDEGICIEANDDGNDDDPVADGDLDALTERADSENDCPEGYRWSEAQGACVSDAVIDGDQDDDSQERNEMEAADDGSEGETFEEEAFEEEGDPSPLVADPFLLDFGLVAEGSEKKKYFLLTASGDAEICIEEIILEDDADGVFSIDSAPDTPFCLDAGRSEPVLVNYQPRADACDEHHGRIRIVYLDEDEQEQAVFVDLVGQCVGPPCIEIYPLDGYNHLGMIEYPGPGVKWGYVEANTDATRQVVIQNCGLLPLEVTKIEWDNPQMQFPPFNDLAFWETPGQFHPYTIAADESVTLDIVFHPHEIGISYSWSFKIESNAEEWAWLPEDYVHPANQPPLSETPITMGVQGKGATKGIDVQPAEIDFGTVTMDCCSRSAPVNILSLGEMATSIENIEIGAGSDDGFRLLHLPQSFPYALGGEGHPGRLVFQTQFCPSDEGVFEGRIEITSDDSENPFIIIPLHGESATSHHQQDTFHQSDGRMVDILWVVDCSGSMGDEQDKLAVQFERFIQQAVGWNADLQLAVVSMDVEEVETPGLFQCGGEILKNRGAGALTNDELISEFTAEGCIRLGTACASSREAGLEAAHAAISPPLSESQNAGFVREDAKLALIFLSDEEDQSLADVSFFIDYFRSIKGWGNPEMLEVYAIVGDEPDGCDSQTGGAAAGQRYIDVADACNPHDNEHFFSICEEDFSPAYDTMANNLFQPKRRFALSRSAVEATIEVFVNGVSNTNWDYHENSNSILFDEENVPPIGATIEVEYDTLCVPR